MRFVKVNSLTASSAKKHMISVYSVITPAFVWWLCRPPAIQSVNYGYGIANYRAESGVRANTSEKNKKVKKGVALIRNSFFNNLN